MPARRKTKKAGQFTDIKPVGVSRNPWEAVAELRTVASLSGEIACAVSRSSSLRPSLHLCANAFVHRLDAAFARIWTLNQKENVLELQASAGLYTHLDGPYSRVAVGPGDLLFFHSDGVYEAVARNDEPFGLVRVLDTVRSSRHLAPAAIIATLFGAVREFAQIIPHDDLTAIVIKVDGAT